MKRKIATLLSILMMAAAAIPVFASDDLSVPDLVQKLAGLKVKMAHFYPIIAAQFWGAFNTCREISRQI